MSNFNPYDRFDPTAEDRLGTSTVTSAPGLPPYGPQPPLYVEQQPYSPLQTYQPQPYQQAAPYGITVTNQTYGSQAPYQVTHTPGGCPKCGGFMQEDFSCLGICCAVVFFPLGLLCCLLMKERKCANCGFGEI
eukprot:Phypoly_transcript_14325.p1 GENE.Phypoly_transcript_14325~~Phypoly_transcript_14325.p1  ORF type:complete len:133 (+),score=13.87 Phypoly_transcript_14325:154-552(+)